MNHLTLSIIILRLNKFLSNKKVSEEHNSIVLDNSGLNIHFCAILGKKSVFFGREKILTLIVSYLCNLISVTKPFWAASVPSTTKWKSNPLWEHRIKDDMWKTEEELIPRQWAVIFFNLFFFVYCVCPFQGRLMEYNWTNVWEKYYFD